MFPDFHRASDIAIAIVVAMTWLVHIVRPLWRIYRGQGPHAAFHSLKWLMLSLVS